MNAVERCLALTKEILKTLNEVSEQNRDEKIELVENLLEQREELLKEIKPPFTEIEDGFGKEIIKLNQAIDTKMKLIQGNIKRDMNGIKNKKNVSKKYTSPYESLQNDGVFYDKKN